MSTKIGTFYSQKRMYSGGIGFLRVTQIGCTAVAEALASTLALGDTVLLNGSIGAGKTHFARSIILYKLAKKNMAEDVPSPTFTLVQVYDTIQPEIWHVDLYRLSSEAEVFELGLEIAYESAICLIEWPGRLGSFLPKRYIKVDFEDCDSDLESRNLIISFQGDSWGDPFNKLKSEI